MAIKTTKKQYKKQKKDLIKMGSLTIFYLFIFAMLLSFSHERDTSFKGLIKEGDEYIVHGKNALALEHFKNVASKYPNDVYIHLKLGKLYRQNNNNYMAKIEYFQAMKLDTKCVEAHVEMANLYLVNGDYDLAEKVIKKLETVDNETKIAKGKFYYKLAIVLKSPQDKTLALIKSYKYLRNTDKLSFEKTKILLRQNFVEIANQYINVGDKETAVKIFNIALKYTKTPEIYNGLASIYVDKDGKKSLEYVKKSMELSKEQKNLKKCYEILMATGKSFLDQNDITYAQSVFQLAKNINPDKNISGYSETPILVNIISTKFNEDDTGRNYLPGISFKIINVTKDKISYINSKVVFLKGDSVFSEKVQQIATPDSPIKPDSITFAINVFSEKSVDEITGLKNYNVKIFLSIKNPDEWRLYRAAPLSK
ncbi:MAG: hypothetical protein WC197_05465 [Candidatus Gastranaerophilaceae bacterium]|jgi:Flp pilus assembly protein TadD